MTNPINRFAIALIATAGLALPAASAMAADAPAPAPYTFTVKTTTDYHVKAGAEAFKRGDFQRSVSYANAALKAGMSDRRAAVAQSNLCASYAHLGDLEKAAEACDAALELRPGYSAAESNKAALTIKLAQK